ncbi:hypothetical protein, partial [Bacillus thuringiensis]|uniref:hypothetical protein n=1 Tax=Bacillus thuringiensis TaxID=1428 RepID=UPI001C55655C
IILYGILNIFSPKKFALPRNITKIIPKIRSLIFLNQKSSNEDFTYIQRQTPQKPFIFLPA